MRIRDTVPVKAKDLVTLVSLGLSLWVIVEAFGGDFALASSLVFFAALVDAADGFVARLTKSANRFGAHLDDLADHFTYTVAPAFIVFRAYLPHGRPVAFALLFVFVAAGTLRLARSSATPLKYQGYFVGLPRSASAMMIVPFLNSWVFARPAGPATGVALVVLLSILGLSFLPYPNHKKGLSRTWWIVVAAIPPIVMALHVFGQTFNSWMLVSTAYLLSPWLILTTAERRRMRESLTAAAA
jgi:phosphatidylserine synthase